MGTANQNFYQAAFRHWIDGRILEEQEEYDNAVCMQGFAAECALKSILEVGYSTDIIRKYSHWGEEMFHNIELMLLWNIDLTAILDPAAGLRLSQITIPRILFKNHPGRRYYEDGVYSKEDAEDCRSAVDSLMKEVARLCLDGYMGD